VVKKEDVKGQTAISNAVQRTSSRAGCRTGRSSSSHALQPFGGLLATAGSNLFRCDADGKNIRRLGFDQVQTFYPQLMDDGRVCYTRWEYNDRSASGLQQLFAMNPDGTKQTGLFANNSEFPFSLMHTRGIPGTSDIMMLSCGHHVGQKGRLALARLAEADDYANSTYDPAKSVWGMDTNPVVMHSRQPHDDDPLGRRGTTRAGPPSRTCRACTTWPRRHGRLTRGAAREDAARLPLQRLRHAHAVRRSGRTVPARQRALPRLVHAGGVPLLPGPYSSRFGVYAMDETGRRELLAFDWGQHCLQPLPVKRRTPPPRLVPKIDYAQGFGTYYVQNVYEGAAMQGARGAASRSCA
jgi:hypothetical protein